MKKKFAGVICCVILMLACGLFVKINTPRHEMIVNEDEYLSGVEELISLGIVRPDDTGDIRENDYLTVMECIEVFSRINAMPFDEDRASVEDTYCPKDIYSKLPVQRKSIINKLPNHLILINEWGALNLDAYCSQSDAVKYSVRAVIDTYDCSGYSEIYEYTTEEEYYEHAFSKGLISSSNADGCSDPITRKEFFAIISKLLYVEYSRGGVSGVHQYSSIDLLTKRLDAARESGFVPMYNKRLEIFLSGSAEASDSDYKMAVVGDTSIDRWTRYGIFDGFPDESFRPDSYMSMTRGEFLHILSSVLGYTNTEDNGFNDLDGSEWYADDVLKALYAKVIDGPDSHHESKLTRRDAVSLLSRAFKISEGAIRGEESSDSEEYITYGELFDILDDIVDVYYSLPRTYGTDEMTVIYGNVVVAGTDIALKNMLVEGNMYITPNVRDGWFVFDNVTVNGTLYILERTKESPCFIDCNAKEIGWLRYGSNSGLILRNSNGSPYELKAGKDLVINEDMSVSWTQPDNMLGIDGYEAVLVDSGGNRIDFKPRMVTGKTFFGIIEILELISKGYQEDKSSIRIYPYSWAEEVDKSDYLEIDFAQIHVSEEGKPLSQQYLETTSSSTRLMLGGNDFFQQGNYYCLTQYNGRGELIGKYVFVAEYSGQEYLFDGRFSFKDEIRIQKITITENLDFGFDVIFTPMPEQPFTVVK